MLAFDSSTPINCQVGIIFPVPPTLGLTKNDSAKLWVIFELVGIPSQLRTRTEDLSVDICLVGFRGCIYSDRTSHVCLFSLI
jgi:hypothetical protein